MLMISNAFTTHELVTISKMMARTSPRVRITSREIIRGLSAHGSPSIRFKIHGVDLDSGRAWTEESEAYRDQDGQIQIETLHNDYDAGPCPNCKHATWPMVETLGVCEGCIDDILVVVEEENCPIEEDFKPGSIEFSQTLGRRNRGRRFIHRSVPIWSSASGFGSRLIV